MTKKIFVLFSILVLLGVSNVALAAEIISLPNPLCPQGATGAACIDSFPKLIAKITDFASNVVGVLAVLIFVWAGILFVTSAGNEERIGKARKALMWGAIGIIIAFAGKGLVAVATAVIGATPTP